MTEDSEERTESDNKVKSQVSDPTNKSQTSQEECCSKGNSSVLTGVLKCSSQTHAHGLSLTQGISGHIWLCTGNVPSTNYHFRLKRACVAGAVDSHEKGLYIQVRMAFQAN